MTTIRRLIQPIFVFYTIFILYFMFFGFDRMDDVTDTNGYTFMWIPNSFYILPDISDLFPPSLIELVGFGNTAAFIPLGILIPMLYRLSFAQFIVVFILCITFLETLQAITKLGSFDINDIIQNSSGAAIGYGAYKLGNRGTTICKKVGIIVLSAIVLMAGMMLVSKGIEEMLTKREGTFTALNEWTDSQGNSNQQASLTPFKIGDKGVVPQFNVYKAKHGEKTTYTYDLGSKDVYIFLNYGIADSSAPYGSIELTVDGQQTLSDSAKYQGNAPVEFHWYFEKAKILTITVEGTEAVWDLGYREMKYFWE